MVDIDDQGSGLLRKDKGRSKKEYRIYNRYDLRCANTEQNNGQRDRTSHGLILLFGELLLSI